MKGGGFAACLLVAFLLILAVNARKRIESGKQPTRSPGNAALGEEAAGEGDWTGESKRGAGSSLPDCSHACGSCRACRLIMVSLTCSSLEEAETCPMAYKCMCRNKAYPVP